MPATPERRLRSAAAANAAEAGQIENDAMIARALSMGRDVPTPSRRKTPLKSAKKLPKGRRSAPSTPKLSKPKGKAQAKKTTVPKTPAHLKRKKRERTVSVWGADAETQGMSVRGLAS